jgi:crossover junction endodeoxyribonuclease RusA
MTGIVLTGSPSSWAAQRERNHMSETMTIILPWPEQELSPNGRCHWRVKANFVAAARAGAYALACEQPEYIGHGVPLTVIMQFFPPDKKHRDLDNMIAMMKSSVDGIFTAKGCNDSQIAEIRAIRHDCIIPGGRVTVTVKEAE